MNIKDLDMLRMLLKSNSLTQASNEQKIHKSNLSKKISSIEQEIGEKLFKRVRGKEGLNLTEKGKYFFEKVENIIDQYSNLLENIKCYPNPSQSITIYTTSLIIEDFIVPNLIDIQSNLNDLKIDFMSKNSLISPQEKERVFTISPKTIKNDSFCQIDLLDFHIKLWASKKYIEKFGRLKNLTDLSEHRILVFAQNFDDKTYPTINWFMNENLIIPQENITCLNSSCALIKAASLGLGIISLAEESIQVHQADLIPIIDQGPVVTMSFSFPKYLEENAIMIKIGDFFKRKFQETYCIK